MCQKIRSAAAGKVRFDRVINHTDGQPTKRIEKSRGGSPIVTPERLARAAATILEYGGKLERLPSMLRAAYEQQRGAKQVDSAVIDAEET